MSTTGPNTAADRPLIGISMGDPLGVGPEVIVKALADPRLRGRARFVIFGLHDVLELAADQTEINPFWWREPYEHGVRVTSGVLLADFDELQPIRSPHPRGPDSLAGQASFRFVEEGIRHLREGTLDALVTAPICKQSWALAGHRFQGHTDLLAQRFEARRVVMSFVADSLRVALASDHVPLFELHNRFTIGLVHQPIDLLDRALRAWFGIEHPHIGVLGLNPHAGENGLLGDEERRIIEPALALARNANIRVTGPLPPDTAFIPDVVRRFDGLVAMYHDQGLIPIKMHAFDRAVNLTLGLDAIRTSPDHGTAFDIAGRNRATSGSMRAALELAISLATTHQKQRGIPAAAP
ncbi:MAG: 4-hydroxythreonine-4-phosphate dehydrogenase PdxA [Phycisphaerae bacterium]|nr:4-hydroxythreonine-4-phosphate dehydrogenase PdxA [Phycisphaerae bacterium]